MTDTRKNAHSLESSTRSTALALVHSQECNTTRENDWPLMDQDAFQHDSNTRSNDSNTRMNACLSGQMAWDEESTKEFESKYDHQPLYWEADDWLNVPPTDSLMTRRLTLASSLPITRKSADSIENQLSALASKSNWSDFDAALARFQSNPSHSRESLASLLLPLPLVRMRRRGGINFLTIGHYSISISRKRRTREVLEIEDRLERILLRLVFWPALCIAVILLMEAIGINGR